MAVETKDSKTVQRINTLKRYTPLFQQLIIKDIKLKYRRSILGYIWSILNPLMIMIIMVFIFSNMFRWDIPNYPVYLIIGQTFWNSMADATNQTMWSITGNAALMKKTYVPKYIFSISKVTSCFVNTLFSLGALLIVFIVCRVTPNWYMFLLPVCLLELYIFEIGLGMFLAQATVFFRDVQYIYGAFLTAWMYATPIFYPATLLPKKIFAILRFNPMYVYIQQFRQISLQGSLPGWHLWGYGFLVSFIMLLLGVWSFYKNQDKFILYI